MGNNFAKDDFDEETFDANKVTSMYGMVYPDSNEGDFDSGSRKAEGLWTTFKEEVMDFIPFNWSKK